MMIEMQRHQQIPDSDTRVILKPYVKKKLPKRPPGKRQIVSLYLFKKDLGVFDPEMKAIYTNRQIVAVMKLIFKKAAQRIVSKLWRMPFPNGMGRVYMKENQIATYTKDENGRIKESSIENLMRECQTGMKRAKLFWNREHTRFPYRDIWNIRRSEGFLRSLLFDEIITRAEDPTKKNYRCHII